MARKKRKKSNKGWVILGILGIISMLGLFFGYHYYSYIFKPNVTAPNESGIFYIHSDWDFEKVADELEKQQLIKNRESFEWVAKQKKYTKNVKPGKYQLLPNWSNAQLVDHLRSGKQVPVNVTFHSISRLTQLAGLISQQIEADSLELLIAMLDKEWMDENGFTPQTIQSTFIPNTYEMYWNTSGEQFVKRMHDEYRHFWTEENKEKAKEMGFTPAQISTIASIVEAETKKRDEMPKVAGLYLNRLKIGMRLQSDPTVVFAVNRPGLKRVYFGDLKVDSPYNTYLHEGLPPGPIGFPSAKALTAVLNAFPSNYLYMCAKPDYSGYHNFANSYQEHQKNAQKYREFLEKEGIR